MLYVNVYHSGEQTVKDYSGLVAERPSKNVSANETGIRRSIEVEYWVVDNEGRLVEPESLVDVEGAEREFVEPMVEVKTTPCETTEEMRDELFGRLAEVLREAEDAGKRLVPLGTPVNSGRVCELPSDRNRVQNRVIGESFRYARYCAGTHVHVEQHDGCEVDQLNTLIALDPALALVNSSPYFDGERTVAGARSKLYRWEAYDGVPHQGRLWRYIRSTDEWRRRLERRHEEFVEAAIEQGIDRYTVETNFDPECSVWTPVQLRDEFGTVEWRSPDTALPSNVLRLADELAGAVETACRADVTVEGRTGELSEDTVTLPEFSAVLVYLQDAIREGLKSDAVGSYLDRMGFSVDDYAPTTHRIDAGPKVSKRKARRIRLEHARRLEEDVRRAVAAEGR